MPPSDSLVKETKGEGPKGGSGDDERGEPAGGTTGMEKKLERAARSRQSAQRIYPRRAPRSFSLFLPPFLAARCRIETQ